MSLLVYLYKIVRENSHFENIKHVYSAYDCFKEHSTQGLEDRTSQCTKHSVMENPSLLKTLLT